MDGWILTGWVWVCSSCCSFTGGHTCLSTGVICTHLANAFCVLYTPVQYKQRYWILTVHILIVNWVRLVKWLRYMRMPKLMTVSEAVLQCCQELVWHGFVRLCLVLWMPPTVVYLPSVDLAILFSCQHGLHVQVSGIKQRHIVSNLHLAVACVYIDAYATHFEAPLNV